MSDQKTVHTTLWLMIFLQTIGSVDLPGKGERKMPAPRAYVSIIVLWTILGIWADTQYSRGAARMSWLLVLTGMMLGPFGARAVAFLQSVAQNFGVIQTSATPAPQPQRSSTPPVRPRVNI